MYTCPYTSQLVHFSFEESRAWCQSKAQQRSQPVGWFAEEIDGPIWNAKSVFLDIVESMTIEQYF